MTPVRDVREEIANPPGSRRRIYIYGTQLSCCNITFSFNYIAVYQIARAATSKIDSNRLRNDRNSIMYGVNDYTILYYTPGDGDL